jgi:chorismate-pyruvate lyase
VGRERRGNDYFREVVLKLEGSEQSVEFGAIKIHLDLFAAAVRGQILQERWPLGHILKDYVISHASRPSAFLRVASDELINSVLGLTGAHVLYGRRNTLFDTADRPLAEIVEILPPA